MDVFEAIKTRRSIRDYRPDRVPEEKLLRCLEAFRLAPSACNYQPWRAIVVRDPKTKERLAEASFGQYFIAEADVVIVACGWEARAYKRMGGYWNALAVDVAIAVDHLTLMAQAEGLGTCWIGAFDEQKVRDVLGIPSDVMVVALTPLGFPAGPARATPRKPLEEIVCYEKW